MLRTIAMTFLIAAFSYTAAGQNPPMDDFERALESSLIQHCEKARSTGVQAFIHWECVCLPREAESMLKNRSEPFLSDDELNKALAPSVIYCGAEATRAMLKENCPKLKGGTLRSCKCAEDAVRSIPDKDVFDQSSEAHEYSKDGKKAPHGSITRAFYACGVAP